VVGIDALPGRWGLLVDRRECDVVGLLGVASCGDIALAARPPAWRKMAGKMAGLITKLSLVGSAYAALA